MISKSQLIKTLGPIGGYAAIRWLMRNEPRIIMFHRFSAEAKSHCVSSKVLEKQLVYLKKNFNVLPLSRLRQAKEQGKQLPENSLVLTVDDGYRDFYEVAFPLLKKYELPATLFVTTGFVNKELWLWPDKITWLLGSASEVKGVFELGADQINPTQIDDASRPELWGKIVSYLLSVTDSEKHEWIAAFAEFIELSLPQQAPKEFEACNWEEVRQMQECGIEIGGHTHTHPSLGRVSSEQLADELQTCFSLLRKELGSIGRDFCYPNGQPSDFNERVIHATKDVGFCSSVTAFYDGLATNELFEMRRHTASEDWFQFCKSVNGVESLMAKYRGAHNRAHDQVC